MRWLQVHPRELDTTPPFGPAKVASLLRSLSWSEKIHCGLRTSPRQFLARPTVTR